jgi:hypothetical protein
MSNDKLDKIIEAARHEHNAPPQVPRERIWERVDAARTPQRKITRPNFSRHLSWTAAVAAVLACGVLLGRWSINDQRPSLNSTVPPAIVSTDPTPAPQPVAIDRNAAVYDQVTVAVLDKADALLTNFRTRTCNDQASATGINKWAGSLLSETRLLMNSQVGEDPELKRLLNELELVLAQLSDLSAARCENDSAWIKNGMERRDTLERIRTVATARRSRNAL